MKSWGAGRRRRGPNLRSYEDRIEDEVEVLGAIKDGPKMAQMFRRATVNSLVRKGFARVVTALGSSDVVITLAGREHYNEAMNG